MGFESLLFDEPHFIREMLVWICGWVPVFEVNLVEETPSVILRMMRQPTDRRLPELPQRRFRQSWIPGILDEAKFLTSLIKA